MGNGIFLNPGVGTYLESTFTPTVTLVGGAGNTVPVYSTNTGRYTRVGNKVFVNILLSGDGGAEGAGTGQLTIALPISSSASQAAIDVPAGIGLNNATSSQLYVTLAASSATMSLKSYATDGTFAAYTGDSQNNATRSIGLSFSYEV